MVILKKKVVMTTEKEEVMMMKKEDMITMEKEITMEMKEETDHSSVLVFYDTELSKKTITQLAAVCSAGEFNR